MRLIVPLLTGLIVCSGALAQVTAQNFGMNLITPLTTTQRVFSGQQRLVKDNWDTIETARGVYNWTAFDADLALFASQGATITYTFVGVPGWANGNAGRAVPPTDTQDFYDFVAAIVARANGRIKYWEIWNEADGSGFWSGTQAQMLAIAQQVYSIVHSACASCLVMTPSTAVNWGVPWMQTYLANGGGIYADVINIHCYPSYFNSGSNPSPVRPEQVWSEVQFFSQAVAYYGLSAKPIICNEGGWGSDTVSGVSEGNKPAYVGVWQILFASAGIPAFWFTYNLYSDASGTWGTLTDQANWLTSAGAAYRNSIGWLSGATFSTPVSRTVTSNLLRNPTGTGMVAGTPGTPPTNWSVGNPDSGHGVSTQFVGSGTEGGVSYVDWRVFGTPTVGALGYVQLLLETATQISGVNGSFFTLGGYVKLQSGSMTNVTAVQFTASEQNGAGTYIDTLIFFNLFPLPLALNSQYQEYGFALKNASAAFMQPAITVYSTIGQAFDITLRIGSPNVDSGSIWSGVITKPGSYQAQIVWDAAGGPTTYTPAGTYTFQRSLGGGSVSISGNVTLTNSPILLENQQWKGWTP